MSREDLTASRVRRMLPSVSEVLKALTARASIEPDIAFRAAREVCAEELKRLRDVGGESVPLEDLVQRALLRAAGGRSQPPAPRPAPPPAPMPVFEETPAPPAPRGEDGVEDPFSETTGAMDLRWDRDAREPFTEPQAALPLPAAELPPDAAAAVQAPALPGPPVDEVSGQEPQAVRDVAEPEAVGGIGDETLTRLSREAESIDLRSVFPKEPGPSPVPYALAVQGAEPVGESRESELPRPFEDDEDTVLTIPRGGRSRRGREEGGPGVGLILGAIVGLAALAGLGYLLTGLWMERSAVPPPGAAARPRPEVPPSPVPAVPDVATPVPQASSAVAGTPAAAPSPVPRPVVSPVAAPATPPSTAPPAGPAAAFAPTGKPPVPAVASPPVRRSRDGLVVTKDRAGQPQVFSIHFTSYQDRAKAERDLKRVSALVGREGYVAEIDLGEKGIWQRVMIGAFATADEAKAVREELAAKGTRDMGWVYRVVGSESPVSP